jgi:hypothetical protein
MYFYWQGMKSTARNMHASYIKVIPLFLQWSTI